MTNKSKYHAEIGRRGGLKKNKNKGFGSLTAEQKKEFYENRSLKLKEMGHENQTTKTKIQN